jgi:hypothetical protein
MTTTYGVRNPDPGLGQAQHLSLKQVVFIFFLKITTGKAGYPI